MALKKFNPTTPSQRNLVLVDKSALTRVGRLKSLLRVFQRQVAVTIRAM